MPATTINMPRDSGLKSAAIASQMIRAGDVDVIVAGGIENTTRAPVPGPHGPLRRPHGPQSLGTVESNASVGLEPTIIGIGPLPAVRKALANAGHEIGDIDPFELNEAFAAQPLAVLHELKNKAGRINPHGGAVTLGHPIGANGAKIPVTLPHQTQRTTTNQGHATPCIAGGQGQAIVIRRSANRDTA